MFQEKEKKVDSHIRKNPRSDKENKASAKKPSSLHEHDLEYSSSSSSGTLSNKLDNNQIFLMGKNLRWMI